MSALRITLIIGTLCLLTLFIQFGRSIWKPASTALTGGRSHTSVIEKVEPRAAAQLQDYFEEAQAAYPPTNIVLLACKREKRLELWTAASETQPPQRIHIWPLTASSGREGPKLREGDRQIPEGFYRLTAFNPNSSYHLSLKLNYPNSFDQGYADAENRGNPGSDIFIHGKAASIGCLAIGDQAIEELYYLVHKVGLDHSTLIIAPHDPREFELTVATSQPNWLPGLYGMISRAFSHYTPARGTPSP